MKKLLVLVLAVLGFSTATFAGSPSSFIYKLNEGKTFSRVSSFLSADPEQRETLQFIFGEAEKRIEKEIAKGASYDEAVNKAIYFNLANARVILSKDQYHKFVCLINLSINNENSSELYAEK
ncbi:hypothetical protein [uncultured Bacteroides sp.]|jgi:glycyl-tRNA synthetase alpha subunit|uniref:hypothetical protein n=1 Tax=uncultured Bacteroides sp. TaxID=162156 RepID=UPI002AA844C4|nr:hypothetical protein [uncultured Bacteroides sp.]